MEEMFNQSQMFYYECLRMDGSAIELDATAPLITVWNDEDVLEREKEGKEKDMNIPEHIEYENVPESDKSKGRKKVYYIVLYLYFRIGGTQYQYSLYVHGHKFYLIMCFRRIN